jgi:hypothetical protein
MASQSGELVSWPRLEQRAIGTGNRRATHPTPDNVQGSGTYDGKAAACTLCHTDCSLGSLSVQTHAHCATPTAVLVHCHSTS